MKGQRIQVDGIACFVFKNDTYTKRRGAPVMLIISCGICGHYLMCYQKDGPGPLLRCYLDRIHHPENLKQRQYDNFEKTSAAPLVCEGCSNVIGTPMIYEKEERPAYAMRVGFSTLRKVKR